MRIAYIAYRDASQESGALKKIVAQMKEWVRQGHETKLFMFSKKDKLWSGLGSLEVFVVQKGRLLNRFLRNNFLIQNVLEWKPEIIYFRFDMYYPSLERLMFYVPTVLEINSDDVAEGRVTLSKFKYLYYQLTRDRLLRKSKGLVFVTHEINQKFRHYTSQTLVLGNGIDLSSYPDFPVTKSKEPRLVFIGYPRHPWNGIDKLVALAFKMPKWHFDIIGYHRKDLLYQVPSNMACHGVLGQSQYEDLLRQSDVGIGTLALHRKQMEEASPLKVLEYLAYGLPVIIGYQETNFPEPVPFLLQLSNSPTNIQDGLDRIYRFVDNWKGKRVSKEEIRHIDSNYIESSRLQFFEQVLNTAKRIRET